MEKSKFVDQKISRLTQYIASQPETFRHQGTVVAGWRTRGGKKRGPYYRLSYRQQGRQRSIYLGRSAEVAAAVRDALHAARRALAARRRAHRTRALVRAGLRQAKQAWNEELAKLGLELKGYEVRGWRRLAARGHESDTANYAHRRGANHDHRLAGSV